MKISGFREAALLAEGHQPLERRATAIPEDVLLDSLLRKAFPAAGKSH